MAMIKPKFAFFQMEIESMLVKPTKAHKPGFGKGPETFNPIDMRIFGSKLVLTMLNPKVLLIAQINQTIIAPPTIRMDNTLKAYMTTDDALEGGF